MDIIEYLRKVIGPRPPEIKIPDDYPQRQLYKTLSIPLDKARSSANPEEHRECFKELYVEKAEGTAYISLFDKNAGEIELKQGLILYSKVDVNKWYIRNDAQTDKKIKLVLSKDIDFFLRAKQVVRITQLIDILEHAKVMYLEADKIKSGKLLADIILSSVLKTAESGACIVIDGASAIPEIKAYNDDPGLSDKTWDEIDKTWDEWEGKWNAQQTLSIKADGSGWIGELVNGKHPISWDTNGKVEVQVAYIKGLIAALIAAGFITADIITANLITTGILKSTDGKTYFDLDNSEIVTVHPNNVDKRVKYSGGGIYVSNDGGASWLGAIVYDEATGKVGFNVSSGIMGKLAGSLLELDHLFAYNPSGRVTQSDNNTEYVSVNNYSYVERGSTGNITVVEGQTDTEIYWNEKAKVAWYMNLPLICIQICDTANNVKKEWIYSIDCDSYRYRSVTVNITNWFSVGQQFKIRRFLASGAYPGGYNYAYSSKLKVTKMGELYPLTYK